MAVSLTKNKNRGFVPSSTFVHPHFIELPVPG